MFVCGATKVHGLISCNVGGVVVDQLLFRFLTCPHVPEIFAIKVECCNIAPNFGRFYAPKFYWAGLPKLIPILSPLTRGTSPGKKVL